MTVVPWGSCNMKTYNEQVATRSKQHFIPRLDEFSEPSKIQIQKIVEVELPKSTCPVKK